VAVVTGGSAGVGREVVRALAARGWDVAVLARGQAGTQAAADDAAAHGRRAPAVECDVADRAAVEAAADRVEDELGHRVPGPRASGGLSWLVASVASLQ
jgi:NAD(P)-dependent dehydrogenase (short-subunit alcohol dehydrogenase family)